MNRRTFLKRLLGAAAVIAAAPLAKAASAFAPKPYVTLGPIGNDFLTEREFVERYIRPAAQALADRIDADLFAAMQREFPPASLGSTVHLRQPPRYQVGRIYGVVDPTTGETRCAGCTGPGPLTFGRCTRCASRLATVTALS